jgi:hypothetical protein
MAGIALEKGSKVRVFMEPSLILVKIHSYSIISNVREGSNLEPSLPLQLKAQDLH